MAKRVNWNKPKDKQAWAAKARQYKRCNDGVKAAKAALTEMAAGQPVRGAGVTCNTTTPEQGTVDWKTLALELLDELGVEDIDEAIAPYRREAKPVTRLRAI